MDSMADFFIGAGGALAGYIIIGLAAAVGKLIGGAILRFRFDEFIFFMVRIGRRNKGIAVSLCNPQPYISCSMIDGEDTRMRNLIYSAFSMAVALFFTETLCIQVWGTKILPANTFTTPMAVVMVGYTVVLVALVGFNQKKKAGNGAASIMRREYERCYAALKEGKKPSELEIQKVEYTGKMTDLPIYKKYLLMLYYHFLDLGDYKNVGVVIDEMENYVPDKFSHGDLPFLCELVFYYVIISRNEGRAKFYGNSFMTKLEGNEGANIQRVFAYWTFFMDMDKGATLQLSMKAMRAVQDYPLTGCREMERHLIEALIKRAEQS